MDFTTKTAVIFDLDGTLVDSAPGIIRSAQYALEQVGKKMDAGALRAFIGPPLESCFSEVCGLPAGSVEPAVAAYREKYHAEGKYECSLYPGIALLLDSLCRAGKRLYVATSKGERSARQVLELFGIAKYFDAICGVCPEEGRASKEDALQYIFDSGKAERDAAVMVGDRKYDIEAAKVHSIAGIGVTYGFGEKAELEMADADALAASIDELAGLLGCSLAQETPLTEVYLVRHAQPDYEVHDDYSRPLTPKGMADRERVTAFLWDKGIDAVYSSPYLRAVDTVRDFAGKKNLPISEDIDFREREMGGKWVTDEEFLRLRRRQWDDFSYSSGDGESLGHVQERVRRAMERLLVSEQGKKVAVGGHGTAFSVLVHTYDPAFGHDDCVRVCRRLPWVIKMVFRGNELLFREECL